MRFDLEVMRLRHHSLMEATCPLGIDNGAQAPSIAIGLLIL